VTGFAFRKTSDAIATFVKQHGWEAPRRAVLCTYDLDPARFEAVVLPELTRARRWFRTLVLADAAPLQKHGVLAQRAAASSYELAPVRVDGQGVFHAKLIVLQAGTHVLIGIGSGNLTAGGLGGNLELMLFAGNESEDGKKLAQSAIQFLDQLRNSPRVTLPATSKRFLERVCLSAEAAGGGPVMHNLHVPLIEQLALGRPPHVARVAVVSPWHSASESTDGVEPEVLARVGRILGAHPRVYTQGQGGNAPALGKGTEVRILRSPSHGGDEYLDVSDSAAGVRHRARLHAKAYLAVGATSATFWFGSANCTIPALCRVAGKGNVELLVRTTLDRKACARLDTDLEAMFEPAKGSLAASKTSRTPVPRGTVLAGFVDDWEGSPRLSIELAAPSRSASLRLGPTAQRTGTIDLVLPKGETTVTLSKKQSRALFRDEEVSPVLWEHHLGAGAPIPFPVSVACVPTSDDPEAMLQDALDDLAGRAPAALQKKRAGGRRDDDWDPDDDERDRELELLTACEHEGRLDRIAVRVELLRRRLAGNGSRKVQLGYESLIKRLALPQELQSVLIKHLESPTRRFAT
jgi:hypothetical protein